MTCTKQRYLSRKEAKAKLRFLVGVGRGDSALRAYRCPACDFWHLGHLPPGVIGGFVTRAKAFG